jgi:predicted Zn-dependent protease with MMP-like domain
LDAAARRRDSLRSFKNSRSLRAGLPARQELAEGILSTMITPAPYDWLALRAPSLAEMEEMAEQAFERLPKRFRDLCEGVIIRVDDFPADDVLDELKAESEFDLLGLFQGIGLPFQSSADPAPMPNMVWLYRRPILDYWAEHDESLGAIVRHVLVHEIGHHFGLSDADMEAIEAQVV